MKEVTLVTCKTERILKTDGGDMLTRFAHEAPRYQCFPDGELTPSIRTCDIPIRHMARVCTDGSRGEWWLAMDPELRTLLEYEFGTAVKDMSRKVRSLESDLRVADLFGRATLERVSEFNNLPWYKRVYRALQGNI